MNGIFALLIAVIVVFFCLGPLAYQDYREAQVQRKQNEARSDFAAGIITREEARSALNLGSE